MAAYIIADIDVFDPEGYAEYRAKVPAMIAAHGGRYLTRGGAVEPLEGPWAPKRCVILEFPDMQRARDFFHSTDYAPLKAIRERTARGSLVIVEGYTP